MVQTTLRGRDRVLIKRLNNIEVVVSSCFVAAQSALSADLHLQVVEGLLQALLLLHRLVALHVPLHFVELHFQFVVFVEVVLLVFISHRYQILHFFKPLMLVAYLLIEKSDCVIALSYLVCYSFLLIALFFEEFDQ